MIASADNAHRPLGSPIVWHAYEFVIQELLRHGKLLTFLMVSEIHGPIIILLAEEDHMKDRSDKFIVDPTWLHFFPSMEEAEKYIKEHATVILIDKEGNERVMPRPGG